MYENFKYLDAVAQKEITKGVSQAQFSALSIKAKLSISKALVLLTRRKISL